jgi:hypothetical protein
MLKALQMQASRAPGARKQGSGQGLNQPVCQWPCFRYICDVMCGWRQHCMRGAQLTGWHSRATDWRARRYMWERCAAPHTIHANITVKQQPERVLGKRRAAEL